MTKMTDMAKQKKEVHYVWIKWENQAGSSHDMLWKNGRFPLGSIVAEIRSIPAKYFVDACKYKFIRNSIKKVTISAQNLHTGETLYRRTINVRN